MLTIKTSEWRHWRWSGIFIVNFEHISHLFLVFLLSTFNKYMLARLCLPVSSSVFRTLSNIYEQAFFSKFEQIVPKVLTFCQIYLRIDKLISYYIRFGKFFLTENVFDIDLFITLHHDKFAFSRMTLTSKFPIFSLNLGYALPQYLAYNLHVK